MTPAPERGAVVPAAVLAEGGRAKVSAFGTDIALFDVDDRLFAVANACPHHGGPLCHGRITGARFADAPYEHRWEREQRILVCPWHGWEFDLETGESLFDPRVRVRTFEARREGDEIVLCRRG